MQGDALQLKYLSIIKCETTNVKQSTVLVPRPALTSPAIDQNSGPPACSDEPSHRPECHELRSPGLL